MLLAYALFHVVSGVQHVLNMNRYYAYGADKRRETMQNLDLTNPRMLSALPEILNTADPFPVKDDFYARTMSPDDANALFKKYFNDASLHPLLFPVSFVAREKELLKLVDKEYASYKPRYIEYDEEQFKEFSANLRNRLLELLEEHPGMLKSRTGKIPIELSSNSYWNAEEAWEDIKKGYGDRKLAIISLLDPSSHYNETEKLTLENAGEYCGNGEFADVIGSVFGGDPISAYQPLYSVLYKRFANKPEMLAFWHARLVYGILSLPNVMFQIDSVKERAAALLKELLATYDIDLIPPMYLEGIVEILARNKVNCDTSLTRGHTEVLAFVQEFAPSSPSIWGGFPQAAKQWGIFLHRNFSGIEWPSSINTFDEAEAFWGGYSGNLKHAIPAFTKLPHPVNFPNIVCTTVLCFVEESVKLYKSAGEWSTEKWSQGMRSDSMWGDNRNALDRAALRLWATAFLHTGRTDPINSALKTKLFNQYDYPRGRLATSRILDYIPEGLVSVGVYNRIVESSKHAAVVTCDKLTTAFAYGIAMTAFLVLGYAAHSNDCNPMDPFDICYVDSTDLFR